jgi:thymidylate synthase
MIKADKYYIENLKRILEENNKDKDARPKYKDGVEANSLFITQVFEEYDLSKGEFPITTLRNTAIKTGINEILWIYQDQDSNLATAHKRNIMWWDDWNIGNGTIGQRYGATIRKWDLLNNVLKSLKEEPFSRRHIINMLQESDLKQTTGLYPCAYEVLFSVREVKGEMFLDMTLNQRSSDYIVANFINKTQYLALQMMIASHLGYKVGKFCHFVQNLHIYDRHIDAAKEILGKEPLPIQPRLELKSQKNFYDFSIDDFVIKDIKGITKIESTLELGI